VQASQHRYTRSWSSRVSPSADPGDIEKQTSALRSSLPAEQKKTQASLATRQKLYKSFKRHRCFAHPAGKAFGLVRGMAHWQLRPVERALKSWRGPLVGQLDNIKGNRQPLWGRPPRLFPTGRGGLELRGMDPLQDLKSPGRFFLRVPPESHQKNVWTVWFGQSPLVRPQNF
jgi:hypothetical protein